jgi:tyrosinase
MQRWESEPLALPTHDVPFAEASLDFEDIRHDGPSFTVYVYFDNPEVDAEAGADGEGYVGQFRVFGHGDCWGGKGHCDVPKGPVNAFDTRPAHPLTPIDLSLDCTDALRKIAEKDAVRVTTLAYSADPEAEGDVLRFAGLSLVTYD